MFILGVHVGLGRSLVVRGGGVGVFCCCCCCCSLLFLDFVDGTGAGGVGAVRGGNL